ncbi:MAG: DUF1707 SHOCT-like domain-containing protein [Pseudonocardiaceae bacterium]
MPDDEQQPVITDDQRERAVERLQGHVGTGDLTLAEFENRVQQALVAQTSRDLERATDGLPAQGTPRPTRGPARRWLVSVFGGSTTGGRWRVARRLRTVSVFGGSDIDLRGAEIDGEEITIIAAAFCGGDTIYLPDSVNVELSGGAFLGGNDLHGSDHRLRPGAPLVRIRAYSVAGGVDVYRVPPEAAALPLRDARRLAKGKRPRRREL